MGGAGCLDHGLVFGCILVGLEQNFVQLLADRCWALARAQFGCPLRNLQRDYFFLLNGSQGLCDDIGGCLAKAPLASAAEVVGRFKQAKQHRSLLGQRRLGRKVVAGQVGKAKLFVRRKLPGHLQLNALAGDLCAGHEFGRRWLFKLQQHIGGLDFDTLAAVELNLRR